MSKTAQAAPTPDSKRSKYRAVSIVAYGPACNEARRIAGVRYLVQDAPKLPLRNCTVVGCNCRYREHEDRRSEPRRSVDLGITCTFYVGPDRRSGVERRQAADDESDPSYFDYFRR